MQRFYTQPIDILNEKDFSTLLDLAIVEDCPEEDITSVSIFSESDRGRAILQSRETGILCGTGILSCIQRKYPDTFNYRLKIAEGEKLEKNMQIAELEGSLRTILQMERILLNFLQYLSGIASTTYQLSSSYPNLLILDTRKTLPGYRKLVKYAVYIGGGANHRIHLSDMALIKDNHIALCGSIPGSVEKIRSKFPGKKIELEIDELSQLDEAILSKPDIIMLDNFSDIDTTKAIEKIRNSGKPIRIECSGGITPEKLKFLSQFGDIGVSMGYITHTTRFLDLGLDIEY